MEPPPRLTYRLEALIWDAQHHFNQQNRYGYNGKGWKRFSDPMLLCEMCDQWFPASEVPPAGHTRTARRGGHPPTRVDTRRR